jgi:uncharacterized membrane protein YgdD (TMEM256/DUF423 family)
MSAARPSPIPMLAAMLGLLGVAAGAFGAHAIAGEQAKGWVATGAQFQMIHVFAMLACVAFARWGAPLALRAAPLFLAGIVLFSGSLYALALGAPRAVAMLAPFGGLSFMVGWIVLAIAGWTLWRRQET